MILFYEFATNANLTCTDLKRKCIDFVPIRISKCVFFQSALPQDIRKMYYI